MTYLSWHYQNLAYDPAAITQASINEYVSHYSALGGMRAGFEHYRATTSYENLNYGSFCSLVKLIIRIVVYLFV